MVMIYFQDHHLLFTMRADQRIIAKRRKDHSTPPVKTTESMQDHDKTRGKVFVFVHFRE